VAVKFIIREKIPPELLVEDPLAKGQKIPIEIQILRSLNHPGIIKYIEHIFEGKKHILLITELHGSEWDPRNPQLNAERNPGLKNVGKGEAKSTGELSPEAVKALEAQKAECSPLFRLTAEQEKQIRRRTSCDLFECIDARKFNSLLLIPTFVINFLITL
jgi:serine/threonine protein kinase